MQAVAYLFVDCLQVHSGWRMGFLARSTFWVLDFEKLLPPRVSAG